MAKLEFQGKSYDASSDIGLIMQEYGIKYENWGNRALPDSTPDAILNAYKPEIETLKRQGGYVTADVIALDPETPNLDALEEKFNKDHYHSEDEVRFVVGGEGIFEIDTENNDDDWMTFTAQSGDLIVVPAERRHLFYLTKSKYIRCIRLFKSKAGWEAIYSNA